MDKQMNKFILLHFYIIYITFLYYIDTHRGSYFFSDEYKYIILLSENIRYI